jgi:hypothetical protein
LNLRTCTIALIAVFLAACAEPQLRSQADASAASAASDAASPTPDAGFGQPSPERDAEIVVPPSAGEPPSASDSCDPAGVHMLTLFADTEWDPASVNLLGAPIETVNAGSGSVIVVGLITFVKDGSGWAGTIVPCRGEVPDFNAIGRKFGAVVPDEALDKVERSWGVRLYAPCTRPNCVVDSSRLTAQLGLNIADTVDWPVALDLLDAGLTTDDDHDGVPGVLVRLRGPGEPGGYSLVPTPLLESISELMVAFRIGSDLLGTVQTCDVMSGDGRRPTLSFTTLGCRISESGRLCDASEVDLVNANFPKWRVTRMKWQLERLEAGATCRDVRNRRDAP